MKYRVSESYSPAMAYPPLVFHPRFETFSRFHFNGFAMAGVLGLLIWWSPEKWGLDRAEDSPERVFLSDRVFGDKSSASSLLEDEEIGEIEIVDGTPSPRVSPTDVLKNFATTSSPDSPDSNSTERSIAKQLVREKANEISGLKMRLLMEAAERALHSETPWSDLAQVALTYKKIGDLESARYWFERASRLAMDPDDSSTGSKAMREVVKSMVSAGFLDLAGDLISRIPLEKEKSRAKTELVSAFARLKRFDEALSLTNTLSDPGAKAMALRSIAEAEARYLDLDDALLTLGMISNMSERDIALGRVAAIRAGLGDSAGTLKLLNQIHASRQKNAAVAKVAEIQAKGGKISIAAMVGLIHDPTFRDETLRALILKEAGRRDTDVSVTSANRIETKAERAKAYESLVMLQLSQGDVDGALQRAQSIRVEATRFRALQAVAVAMAKDTGAKSARNVVNLIGDSELRDATYRKIAQRVALVGQSSAAIDTIRFMINPAERAVAYASVALTCARYGGDQRARLILGNANRELSQIESPREQAVAQGIVAEVFAETGDPGSAFDAASEIANSALRDMTYRKLALSFAKSDDPASAEESASKIERETSRETALDSVALTLAGRVAATEALNFVARLDGFRQQVRFLLGVASRKS